MLRVLMLLLPALIPSWDFFRSVEPSPRVQWRMAVPGNDGLWVPFRPRPQRLDWRQVLIGLVWNPVWNETLYVTALAERLMEDGSDHTLHALQQVLSRDIAQAFPPDVGLPPLEFRLVFVHRDDAGALAEHVSYQSHPWAPDEPPQGAA